MEKTLFQFLDYKPYLKAWIASQPVGGYGMRGKMAEAIGCQTAFISQVLNGGSHLSLEQAERLNGLLGHNKAERAFFLLLVQHTRAGSEPLRRHFRELIQEAVDRQSNLKERLRATKELSPEDHATYFSSWIFAAVHASLSIPPFQTKGSIAKSLGLPLDRVSEVLEFLVERGLVTQKGDRFSMGSVHIHFGKDTSLIAKHHLNWRLQAMHHLDSPAKNDLHYSSVVAIAREDAARLSAQLADALAATRKIVEPSQEEALYSICLDFFALEAP
ncbi:MAG: TIGR02147 family protein [Bdellovibrionota bacterium]